jgi:murein DD-endopeptidase MepM/ murein hydrolase activator NlpD
MLLPAVAWVPAASGTDAPAPHTGTKGCDIVGTQNNDILKSNDRDQTVCGLGGKDTLVGNGGDDTLKGGPGNDDLKGGTGNDDLYGGLGSDMCRQLSGHGAFRSCEWPNPLERCPVDNGTVYNDFGDPRDGHTHQGNDILDNKGARVYATFPGMASRHYDAAGAGYYVMLVGDRGFTYGMHMLKKGRADGHVHTGDVIGHVGSTGNAGSVNHLHFEWHPKAKGSDPYNWPAVDPFPYLSKVCKNTANAPTSTTTADDLAQAFP